MANGKWIRKQKEEHYCDPPKDAKDVTTGDVWECGVCHRTLTATVMQDQRDGPWLEWSYSNGVKWDRYKAANKRAGS
jgi:hypothetical protein